MRYEIMMAGSGGQGVLSIGMLLAHAALLEGKQVSWLPSYSAEQRGGPANCSVIISDRPVASPLVVQPDLCLVMDQLSMSKFGPKVRSGGKLYVNSSLIKMKSNRQDITTYLIPANETAIGVGDSRAANMVMLGALVGSTRITAMESILESLRQVLPASKHALIPLNQKALTEGAALTMQDKTPPNRR